MLFYRLRSNQRGRILSIVGDFGIIGLESSFERIFFSKKWRSKAKLSSSDEITKNSPAGSVLAIRARISRPKWLASDFSEKPTANFYHESFQPVEMLQIGIVNNWI